MIMNNIHTELFKTAFKKLLGTSYEGAVVYVKCLNSEVIRFLCASSDFNIQGWTIYGVTEYIDLKSRVITADYAVEIREDKKDAVLLLVDVSAAGAGMDGIYSAGRELREKELFDVAHSEAHNKIPHGYLRFCKKAVARSRRIGGRNTISPWREFEFYSNCADINYISSSLSLLGLWPIQFQGKPDLIEIDKSIRLVEHLLLRRRSNTTAESSIEGLMLIEPTEQQLKDLSQFVRESSNRPFINAINKLTAMPHLWLNNLKPGIFDQNTIQQIEMVPWRGRSNKPTAWSGLIQGDDDRLRFILDPNETGTRKQSKLEVKWKALPLGLVKGSAEFTVTILSGEEELSERRISHTGKDIQKCAFAIDDFELEEGAKFEAVVCIKAVGDDDIKSISEDFLLLFGEAPEKTKSSSGAIVRALVEGAIGIASKEDFDSVCSNQQFFGRDSKGFLTFRCESRNTKIYRPSLIHQIEENWANRKGAIGRWVVTVRTDGSQAGGIRFVPLLEGYSGATFDRFSKASQDISLIADTGQGLMGIIHGFNKNIEEYINAWLAASDDIESDYALLNTLEVQSISGNTIGLIVLPSHPLRLAWHFAYDQLLIYYRYEENVAVKKIQDICMSLDGSHYPAFLPGLKEGESFVFGDTLGFYTTAMVSDKDREPKASIAILAKSLSDGNEDIAPSIGKNTSDVLATEISRYINLHSIYKIIHLHALRPGDGMTIGRALGKSLEIIRSKEDVSDDPEETNLNIGFVLELYPSAQKIGITGKFFSSVAERKRAGSGYLQEDGWILENYNRNGNIAMPRLSWAKREDKEPQTSAHVSVAFDTFDSEVVSCLLELIESTASIEVYGLSASLIREFSFSPQPIWKTYIAQSVEGEKHPARAVLSERIVKIHSTIMKTVSKNLGAPNNSWPILRTEMYLDKEESIRKLHKLSDWVITIDRNAGVEYFDSPKEKIAIYDAYIIDCVPEREDLGLMQMVTSTSNFDEVVTLLDSTLAEMGLSSSPRNCMFFLNELKALSGRFAMRLSGSGYQSQELIAVSMTHANCNKQHCDNQYWFPLNEGFIVPIDDVPHLLGTNRETSNEDKSRADLLYVAASKRGGLQFAFVEIKFRRYLKTARNAELLSSISNQLNASRKKWEALYGEEVSSLEKSIKRNYLARILKFYASKGLRHSLNEKSYQQIMKEIDRMVREGDKYTFPSYEDQVLSDRGYIFCPEYNADIPSKISYEGDPVVILFGASHIPDAPDGKFPSIKQGIDDISTDIINGKLDVGDIQEIKPDKPSPTLDGQEETHISLGKTKSDQSPIHWNILIKSNPHLMMVGLPGMGKTTSLINICLQMIKKGISPIVFSYHEDIDEQLSEKLGIEIQFVDYEGLGFNPLQVVLDNPMGYIDNISRLRDIFATIFPDLGDIQLGKLRESLKQSYIEKGWGNKDLDRQQASLPSFRTFYETLKANTKQDRADKGLLVRLGELDDYEFFNNTQGMQSLLDINKPALIRIHKTQNEVLQNAFATFVLHNLYQQMFVRGVQSNITHAIIFDEAHRAASLKLIPTMAKECRKFGISFVLASQEVKDFDQSLFNAVANYLILRLNENDAKIMAKLISPSDQIKRYTDRIKHMPKYHGLFFGEALNRAAYIELINTSVLI